jgi:5-methylcytosine-specific restriction endonuclease McrA
VTDTVYSRWLAQCSSKMRVRVTGGRGRMDQWERREAKALLMAGRPWVQCHYCGKWIFPTNATLDHIVPRSRGGDNSLSNLLLCCRGCNQGKGSTGYQDFVSKVAA